MAFMALETPLDTRLPVGPLGRDAVHSAPRGGSPRPEELAPGRLQAPGLSVAFARQVSSMLWTSPDSPDLP